MKVSLGMFLWAICASIVCQAAASDPLAKESFSYSANDPGLVLEKTAANLKAVFKRYQPALDSSTTIVSPLKVGGSDSRPTINVVLKKCVLFVCETVELDASISMRDVAGKCQRQFVLDADLRRSSKTMSDNYQALKVDICYRSSGQKGQIDIDAFAVRAPTYSEGVVTDEILKMLVLQVKPMSEALRKTLAAGGARVK